MKTSWMKLLCFLFVLVLGFGNTAAAGSVIRSYDDGGDISEKILLSISATKRTTTYYVGDTLSISDISVTAKYSDGTSADVTDYADIGDDDVRMDSAGTYTIYVEYGGCSARIKISVVKKMPNFTVPSKWIIGKKSYPYNLYCSVSDGDLPIKSIKSSNPKIVTAKFNGSSEYGSSINFNPKKAGTATITLQDSYGRVKTVRVTVKKYYIYRKNMDEITPYTSLSYGRKKIEISTAKKTKITVKIGGITYKKKAGKSGKVKIKVSKLYKVGKKFSVTARRGKYKTKRKFEVSSAAWGYVDGSIWSCKNYVPYKLFNLTKGDVVKVTSAGQVSKWKVRSNTDSIFRHFYFKNVLGRTPSVKIKIKNKYGQLLYKRETTFTWR